MASGHIQPLNVLETGRNQRPRGTVSPAPLLQYLGPGIYDSIFSEDESVKRRSPTEKLYYPSSGRTDVAGGKGGPSPFSAGWNS